MRASNLYYFAADNYSCDAYGANAYSTCSSTSTGSSSGSSGGGVGGILADTGYVALVPVALAVAIAGAAVILLIKRLRRDKRSGNGTE